MSDTKTHPSSTPGADGTRRYVLALSRLAPDASATVVADIFKRARDRHRELDIFGAMLFDGERFGVLLCGAPALVEQALDALTVDPWQALPVVLADGPSAPPWAGGGWRSGWSEPDGLAPLAAADAPRDGAALQAWRVLIGTSDLL